MRMMSCKALIPDQVRAAEGNVRNAGASFVFLAA
jgi:hypothetical protein